MLLGCYKQGLVEAVHRCHLAPKHERALSKAADHLLPEFGRKAGGAIGLALAVFLDLLVGVVPMQLDDGGL